MNTQAIAETFFPKVYSWMAFGLSITAAIAWITANSEPLLRLILGTRFLFMGLLFGELILVGWLASRVFKMSYVQAGSMFVFYSALNGLTLSIIFLVYTTSSIASVFLLTAGMFGAFSLYGYTTKKDLTSWGSLLFMGLIGLILAGIINIFLRSTLMGFIYSIFGVIIFVGLTAYDTQKLKRLAAVVHGGSDTEGKAAILGALTLYLDFINLFLFLLRLFGGRRD